MGGSSMPYSMPVLLPLTLIDEEPHLHRRTSKPPMVMINMDCFKCLILRMIQWQDEGPVAFDEIVIKFLFKSIISSAVTQPSEPCCISSQTSQCVYVMYAR